MSEFGLREIYHFEETHQNRLGADKPRNMISVNPGFEPMITGFWYA